MSILFSSNFQWVLLSTLLLGMASGLIGCLAHWKRQSLMSDALSHAALPGVVVAFMIFQEKNFFVLLIGAGISALIGAFFIQWIKSSSRITEDTAMGMILAVFYGGGIVLLTMVNRGESGNQAGLDSYIFGQAASMVAEDVRLMSIVATIVILIVIIGFKEWKLFLFDPDFAKGLNLSIKGMNVLYLGILVLTIVIGIQAVGVILMSALIIFPPVSARYWTHSFKTMISHTVLLGIVVAYIMTNTLSGIYMLIGAALTGILTTFLVQWFRSRNVPQDASIGIVFTTLFAIGVILIATKTGNAHLDVQHALMGEITFIPWNVIHAPIIGEIPMATFLLLVVLFLVILVLGLFYKEWKITSFDPALAASIGIPVLAMHYLFMTLVSITTVAAFDAVGAIMVVAMLIVPAASAYLWTDRLSIMLVLSASFGVLSALMGYYFATWIDSSISGSMAFATGIVFLFSFIFSPKHGLLSRVRPSTDTSIS